MSKKILDIVGAKKLTLMFNVIHLRWMGGLELILVES